MAIVLLVDHYIRHRIARRKRYNVVSLDVQKAFDTVSHDSIKRALKIHNVESKLATYLCNSLKGTTSIKIGHSSTKQIIINRGVKHGGRISPLLFILVIDELLDNLETKNRGGTIGSELKCPAVTFADDIVIQEDDEEVLPLTLIEVQSFFRFRGMDLNPAKSSSISSVVSKGKRIKRTRPSFKIAGHLIPAVGAFNLLKYLVLRFSATGALKPSQGQLPV